MPDLVPLPVLEVEMGESDDRKHPALRLSVGVANRGDYALDLLGVPEGSTTSADARQCTTWLSARVCDRRESVGKFVWHPAHGHYHFEDFATYELRKIRKDAPDMRPQGLVAGGDKVSFCLIDGYPENEDASPTERVPHPLYLSCLAGAGQQGISSRWVDAYGKSLEGQQIVLDGVRSGAYALVITTDPENRLLEASDANNQTVSLISIDRAANYVQIVCDFDEERRGCYERPAS